MASARPSACFATCRAPNQLEIERTAAGAAKTRGGEQERAGSAPAEFDATGELRFRGVRRNCSPEPGVSRRAVQEFLKSDNVPNTFVTVYKLDRRFALTQPYTSDKDLLAKAVDAASKGFDLGSDLDVSVLSGRRGTGRLSNAHAANVLLRPPPPRPAAAVENDLFTPIRGLANDPLFSRTPAQDVSVVNWERSSRAGRLAKGLRLVQQFVEWHGSMDALHALVRSQEKLPGRRWFFIWRMDWRSRSTAVTPSTTYQLCQSRRRVLLHSRHSRPERGRSHDAGAGGATPHGRRKFGPSDRPGSTDISKMMTFN